ncbi:MAG TPA: diguanylate cyclase [Mogibacterium sp.]|nr:diguanylate cyclase [Mogibacterium sp.]
MKYDTIISLIFYICGCFYLIYGSAIVVTSARNDISKLFLFLTSSLAIWSFAYSISNSVSTAEASAFWRSFSVLGWGSFNSFLLHFITLLTKTETRLSLRSKLVVFYLPSVINVILFGPFGVFLEKQYVMVQTDFGWINIAPMYPAKIWLILYFIVFSVASLIFLVKWWKKIRFYTSLEKREAKFFLASILVFFLIEIVVDFLPDISRKIPFPKMPVVLLLIPTILLFSLLKKSELIKRTRDINFFPESSKSITTEVRLRLFNTAATIFVIGSALYFLIGYFGMKKALGYELLFSAALLLMGITLRVLPRITQNQTIQNTAFAIISTFGFMLFMIKDSDTGALTVWASYILFFILTVVMGNPIHIYGFATISIIAQVVLWIVRPQVSVIIDINEYIGRIFIIILSFIAVRYLTDEYASKIDGYQGLLSEQEALERISSSFISIDSENAKEKIDEMMEMAAEILKFKNAILVRFSEEYENATILNMYAKDIENVPSIYQSGNKMKISDFPLFKFLIDRNTFVICEDIANISFDEDGRQKEFFMDRGVKSFFAMPIIADNKIDGVFIVEYNDRLDTGLAQSRLNLLQIIANMLGDANKKLFYEEKLYNFAYFDEATKLANRNMLKKKLGEIIKNGKGREKIAIIDFELENLRMINDTFGQSVGDKIVMRSVEILKNQFDECCYISRPGIREFIVVMPDVKNRQQIEHALKRLMNSFSRPLLTDNRRNRSIIRYCLYGHIHVSG